MQTFATHLDADADPKNENTSLVYDHTRVARFVARPSRFTILVELDGREEKCHLPNTGRCTELLTPGAQVVVRRAEGANRATAYSLVATWKGERLINLDSGAPNKVFMEYLRQGAYIAQPTTIRPETRFGDSRFDFYVEAGERRAFIEVKGVTMEQDGVAMFPDAPTERGVKHVRELIAAVQAGYEAHIAFVIQMRGVARFMPNAGLQPAFALALCEAQRAGVHIAAFDCDVAQDSLRIGRPVPVALGARQAE